MPINSHLPTSLKNAGWKIKIREKETLEPPHITILHGTQAWRINLRTGEFMDKQPDPDDVPECIVKVHGTCCAPHAPVVPRTCCALPVVPCQ